MLLFLHIHVFAVIMLAMIGVAIGYYTAWKTRNKRINGLEEKIISIQNELTQSGMEYGNLEQYKNKLEEDKGKLDTEIEQLKHSIQSKKKSSTTTLPTTINKIQELERKNTVQKKKIQNLHIKMSELSITLKKVKDARNNWQVKYNQLASEVKPQASANMISGSATRNFSGISSNFENQRLLVLDSIAAKAKAFDFERIGVNYSKHDLKLINGIGVLLEKKLNALNISSLAQIASLEDQDIMTINDIIGLPKTKIVKENWVTQAQTLLGVSGKDINLGKKLNTIASMRKYINPASIVDFKDKEHNLQLINTLTPLDITKLNALGIYNVAQIVDLNPIDITNVTNILGLLKGRIENEYWLEQAQDILLSSQTGSTLKSKPETDYIENITQAEKSPIEQEVIIKQ